MFPAGVDVTVVQGKFSSPTSTQNDPSERSPVRLHERLMPIPPMLQEQSGPRRTPRKSLIVVLPENHEVSPDRVAERLQADGENEQVDVILACAGQPSGIAALRRRVQDLQVLLAPPGTSPEDLRELAMNRAPGDIVTLLNGTPVSA